MLSRAAILTALQAAVAEANDLRDADDQLSSAPDAPLGTRLDSLGTVNLLLAAEQHVAAAAGTDVALADMLALTGAESPFATLDTLTDAVLARLAG